MKIKSTSDGAEFEGTPLQIVRAMRAAAAFAPTRTEHEFMVQAAERAAAVTGKKVRTDDPEVFLEDLVGCGFVEDITEGDQS